MSGMRVECRAMRIDPRVGHGTDTWVCTREAGHAGEHAVVVTRHLYSWVADSPGEETP